MTTVEVLKSTALDPITTALQAAVAGSATTATTQAGIATTKASEAAASAATALNAIAQAFKGGLAGASVPATSALAGDTYRITSAGTSQSKTWAIGDAAIYNGTSGSWTQLPGYFSVLETENQRIAGTFESTGYGVSDGVTTNRGIIRGPFVAGTRGWIAGVPTLTVWFKFTPPVSLAGSEINLFSFGSNANGTGYYLTAKIENTGTLMVDQTTGSYANYRRHLYAGFLAAFGGKECVGQIVFTKGTTKPVVILNGVDITSSFGSAITAGTPPEWLDSSMVPTYHITAFNWPVGEAPFVVPILGALTTNEAEAIRLRGKWPLWVVKGGSAASITAGAFVVREVYVITAIGTTDFTLIGAASNTVGVQFTATGVGTGTGTAIKAGALTLPRYQPITVVEDVTGIGDNYGRLVGITPVVQETPDGMEIVVPYNYTGSSIQLMGGAVLDGQAYRVDSVTGTSSASVNLSLGTSASGTQIVNAQAVNGNFDIATYASRITTGTSLYLTFSGNTTGTVKIKLSRLN
jgi:hypothetical protein